MKQLSTLKYKDLPPKETINIIKNKLHDLNILPIEEFWKNSVHGIYSVHLKISETNIFSNGKGTSQEYALASAYGELIERLQNQTYFRLLMNLSKDALKYKGFYYAPDEKYISIKDMMNTKNNWFNKQLSMMKTDINENELLNLWALRTHKDAPSDFIALPYLNIKNNNLSYIPIKMNNFMYASNGMCAGNTKEEALIQGICETLERVANKEILSNNVIPPTIPRKYLEEFPRINAMIEKIESYGNNKVIIKDCSLGKGYPVVGLVFVNRSDQTFFVKFGSHPVFEIAIERTLTEFLQGRDINNIEGAIELTIKNNMPDPSFNIRNILSTGSGNYPIKLLSQKYSYKFKEFKDFTKRSNKEMLSYLTNLLEKQGFDILVRDVSFLGFPSFHIIVPGLSEIYGIDDLKTINKSIKFHEIVKYIKNIHNTTDKELEIIIESLINSNYNFNDSITELLDIPIKPSFPWYNIKVNLFIGTAYYRLGDFVRAYEYYDKFISDMKCKYSKNKALLSYYKCVRDYIGARIDNMNEKDTFYILNTFYPPNLVEQVISNLKDNKRIFNKYGHLDCWNCENCKLASYCFYQSHEKIYKTLKERYFLNQINQKDIIKLL